MFQSTHPHGVRQPYLDFARLHQQVSIHAPARGATTQLDSHSIPNSFQSTHPHGVRPTHHYYHARTNQFQSTHPHGVRQCGTDRVHVLTGFNPRTRTGCDTMFPLNMRGRFRFQSTHPHGVRRRIIAKIICGIEVSIHAPARGATNKTNKSGTRLNVSIHAPARGATKQ